MRRSGHLFELIPTEDNLRLAVARALRGKRHRVDAIEYVANLDLNLFRLSTGIREFTIPLGRHHQFVIHDPKRRVITAPCFEERVVHHAIMNVCEKSFEKWLIADTYACRVGKGRESAVQRAQQFARRDGAYLKLDMRQYFLSIDRQELLKRLCRLFKDERLLLLFEKILNSAPDDQGLPIGSLMSQHFANFYLGWFDRFVTEKIGCAGYVRYMDDVVVWDDSLRNLRSIRDASREFLERELHLKLKPCSINHSRHGVEFLGCRVFPTHVILSRRSRVRFQRRLKRLEAEYVGGEIDELTLQQRGTALVAFTTAAGAKSWQFRQSVLERLAVSGHRLEPVQPGRELEELRPWEPSLGLP